MNDYRVDVAMARSVPVGMLSILYIGDDWHYANRVFNGADVGRSPWGEENAAYGVILSVWNPDTHEYVVKRTKGLGL